MELSRRALLSMVPASALLALAEPLRARAAGVPRDPATGEPSTGHLPAGPGGDLARLAANTVAVLAGTAEVDARPEVAGKVAAITGAAQDRLEAMDAAGDGELFQGLGDLGTSDKNLTKSFQYLYEIALATRTPADSNPLHGDEAVQRRVIDGLTWLHDHYYGDQSKGYYGNWHNWEIGISQQVSKILVLLRDQLAAHRPDLTATYVAAMDGYLRNGKDGDVDLDSRFHTGANLADITTDRIMQGAALGDDARVSKAVADQLTVLATIDPYELRHGVTDGFYADGSFIQHASVAYTGTYGTGLLSRVVQTLKILDGTAYLPRDDMAGVVRGWVVDGFAPVIFEGWMMEAVKGRGVSRAKNGYADATTVLEAVTDLAAHSSGDDATALKGYVKFVREAVKVPPDPTAFVSPVTVARYADILADGSVPARDLREASYTTAFNAMDRTVHHRPGWAFALARSSRRISKYEYMSGENLKPWFQGDGAHYLYLSEQDQSHAFGVDYFAAVSPYRLAGVTAPVETRRTVPELYGSQWYDNPDAGFTASSEKQNTYVYFPCATDSHSGGATLGAYGTASLVQSDDVAWAAKQAGRLPDDFVAYRNAGATKSWFLLDDEIVVLAAGVHDPAGRAVTTTVDSRIAAESDDVTLTGRLREGTPWRRPGPAHLAWLRYANADEKTAVGYVFLDAPGAPRGPRATVSLETVTRSLQDVNAANPDTRITKQVFSVLFEQPPGAPATTLAYALVPGATERQLRRYAHGPLTVLANTPDVQAIRHRGLELLAANSFAPGTCFAGPLAMDGPASVLVRRGGDGVTTVAVADPTTERDTVTVTLHGRSLRAVSADDGVRVTRLPGATRIEVATRHAYGRSFAARLR
ncbi:silent information regulator protein Sir2 [Streptomyces abyssalis]|uniref:Silent information regulator protein Sir2 n=1 Tax=Streptomyces abyssalis TaxID=933944 RepID=A0A1E7JN84_9ACTN|nr:polysaccharide lyase family 8 super-sandwich domain-containing protein [Streptomyces abyssalis]OEU86888.1 silent information regulator protein Sir2 [Streptomyces abyssalis]OEU89728.1 silent information regulator protein Sir2 [Streptomyces abyssalis]